MPNQNLYEPTRQSVRGILVMFAYDVQRLIRNFWVLLVVIVVKIKPHQWVWVGLNVLIVLAVVFVIAYLRYRNFYFYIDKEEEAFVLEEGIISKRKTVLRLNRIQQVNLNRNLIQRLVNVYSLSLDSAGSQGNEISIKAVDKETAESLREVLGKSYSDDSNAQTETESSVQTPKSVWMRIPVANLVKSALITRYGRSFALLLGFFGASYNSLRDLSEVVDTDSLTDSMQQHLGWLSFAVFIALAFMAIMLINLGQMLLKYFDFHIVQLGENMQLSRGLIHQKQTLLKPLRVQSMVLSQNVLQKRFGLFDLRLRQIGSSQSDSAKAESSAAVEIPACGEEQVQQLLHRIYGKHAQAVQVIKPNYRFMIREFIRLLLIPLVILTVLSLTVVPLWSYFFWVPLYGFFVGAIIVLRYRNYRLYLGHDTVIKQWGWWQKHWQQVRVHQLQGISRRQFPWHQRSGVAHYSLHTAAGDLNFDFASIREIEPYTQLWLQQIEQSHKAWM